MTIAIKETCRWRWTGDLSRRPGRTDPITSTGRSGEGYAGIRSEPLRPSAASLAAMSEPGRLVPAGGRHKEENVSGPHSRTCGRHASFSAARISSLGVLPDDDGKV